MKKWEDTIMSAVSRARTSTAHGSASADELSQATREMVENTKRLQKLYEETKAERDELHTELKASNRAMERVTSVYDSTARENASLKRRLEAVEKRLAEISAQLPQNSVEWFFLGIGKSITSLGRALGCNV